MSNRIPTLQEFEQMGRLSIEEIYGSYADYAATKNTTIATLTARLAEAERLLREWESETHPEGYGTFFDDMSREVRGVSEKTKRFLKGNPRGE